MLSFVVPAVNKATISKDLISNFLNQSLSDTELIIVTDSNFFDATDERIKYINASSNCSIGSALNIGLENASGEFVTFLPPNSRINNYSYESIMNKIDRYDLEVIKFANVGIETSTSKTIDYNNITLSSLRPGDFHRELNISDPVITKINKDAWSAIYKTSLLRENNISFDDLNLYYDRTFFYKAVSLSNKTMASRDYAALIAVDTMDKTPISLYKDVFDGLKHTFSYLETLEISSELFYSIITAELNQLFSWFKDYIAASKNRDSILNDIINFLSEVEYRNALSQKKKYFDLFNSLQIKSSEFMGITYVDYPFYHNKSNSPKVSVVVPTYNQEEYLNEALFSLSMQKLEDIEFVVVNDGSKDRCMVIYREFAEFDKRFKLIDKENTGYGNTMNVGIDASTGEYLGILEPDDYVVPNMFSDLYSVAKENNLDFVKADFNRFVVNSDGSNTNKRNNLSSDKSFYNRVLTPIKEKETFTFIMNTWSGIYSMKFLNKWHIRHNETPGASYQDNGFWFQTFARAERAYFVDIPYYMNRRDNPNSSMFAKGKFYCVTNEYKFIWDWMNKDQNLVKELESIYYRKKYGNFITTFYRIAPEVKKDYLKHFKEEFDEPMKSGKLVRELFDDNSWMMLNEILEDPEGYADKVKVSIIMPVYNAELWVKDCLDSLLVKDEIKVECICVDDGSTDGTMDILREYEKNDYRVKVIQQENAGAGAARNNGMQYATGEYWMFLDCDDIFDPDTIKLIYNKSHSTNADITVFRSNQFYDEVYKAIPMQYTIKPDLLPIDQPFAGVDIQDNIFSAFVGWPWDKMFKAEFVKENNLKFQVQRTTNDLLFVYSAIAKAERICTYNGILAHHRRLNESLSVTREKSWFCFYDALCALKKQLIEWNLYDRFEKDFINYSLNFSLWNINSLKGESYYKLYEKLKTEWWNNLQVTGKPEKYFYNSIDYEQYSAIMRLEADEYIEYKFDNIQKKASEIALLNNANQKKIKDLNNSLTKTKKEVSRIKSSNTYKIARKIKNTKDKILGK